jgi:catechol 2,3-dioxygenase-like lactoylglutathione lyase family enzyme
MDKLHHVAVVVPDIQQALQWYEDASWALLRFGNIDLALVLPGQHPPHIAIERPDASAYGPLRQHRDGTASVYVNDPFGNVIEIMQAATSVSGEADAANG